MSAGGGFAFRGHLLVAALLLAASSPAGAWLPVLPRGASTAGCGIGHAMMRAWWRRSTHRTAGALKAANEEEEPPATLSNGRMLDALPLPLLPSPFNATLVGLLGKTPSRWLAGRKKDWSVTGSGTDPPSSAARTYSSPQIPTPAGGRFCCLSPQPLCRLVPRGHKVGIAAHCCFTLLVSPSVSPDVPCDRGCRSRLQHVISKNTQRISVDSLQQLQDLLQDGVSVYKMDIRGISLPGCQVYLFIDELMYYLLL